MKHIKTIRGLADWLASQTGGTVNEAVTTESCYISIGSGKVRLSGHTKYGMNHPCHVLPFRVSVEERIYRLRRAVVAAKLGLDSFAKVKKAVEAENIRIGSLQYSEDGLISLAGM